MDIKKIYFACTILIPLVLLSCSGSKNTSRLNPQEVSGMLDSKNFVFVAEKVSPMSGRTRILTSSYDVTVSKDSVISYLPYFGRAYSAPIDPSDVSTHFTSTNFEYKITETKKGRWNVLINPKDVSQIQELSFTVFENGSTTLNLLSTSKSPISYSGYIKKRGDK